MLLDESTDFGNIRALKFAKGSTWALEHHEGWHGCDLENLLDFLHLVDVAVNEHVVGIELLSHGLKIGLDQLAWATPGSGHLNEGFFVTSANDSLLEFLNVVRELERHFFLFLIFYD